MRTHYLLLWLSIFLVACSTRTNTSSTTASQVHPRMLIYGDISDIGESLEKTNTKANWQITKALNSSYLVDDSLKNFQRLVLSSFSLSQLNHRQITSLRRFMEAGGGILALTDSSNNAQTQAWGTDLQNFILDKKVKPESGKLLLLSQADHSPEKVGTVFEITDLESNLPDYSKATTLPVPDSSRYTYQVLSQGMNEPMQMALLPGNNVLFVERKGAVKLFDANSKQTKTIANIEVFSGIEDGLLGVAADPGYARNNWIYLYYAVPGEKAVNRLARMELRQDNLDRSTEKFLLEIPTQRKYCCHSAGYLHFGPDGLLYLATGDNTNAEETEGYIPIDERPGRQLADDQATAANSNDLRGKILRIKPEPDGSYSIPEGNLFPVGTPKTRPEIYTMGHRNPYRFSVDPKNNFVYWGDIGPDTKVPASEGTLSYDEINQARKPGFYGWPYFLGNNEVFPYYDYATKAFRSTVFNPQKPINNSPNNTGIRELPPAQPAMIWYGDGASKHFPLVGKGGESALAGPVYYSDLFPNAPYKLPSYYDGKLIIYDWVRRWFMAVSFDENKNYLRMEPFLDHITFAAPTDMQIAPDGAIYILEYGTNWFAKNNDARLIRVEYAEGNRKPIANIKADNLYGAVPFQVKLSAADSKDYDKNDSLQFTWEVAGKHFTGEQITYTFTQPGIHDVTLTVSDNHRESSTSMVQIKAGNAPPEVNITTTANRSFYWDNTSLDYQVKVKDTEDKVIDPKRVSLTWNYMPQGKDVAVALTRSPTSVNVQFAKGQYLVSTLDCKACHSQNQTSVGPAYVAVAARYSGKVGVEQKLAHKIITGGSGNWGQRTMSAHPDLPEADATEIVRYILSLKESTSSLPLNGNLALKSHLGQGKEGSYLLTALYTDKGANAMEPLSDRDYILLRNPLVQVEDYDEGNVKLGTVTTEFLTYATTINHQSFVKFKNIDLTHLKSLTYRVQTSGPGGNIEVHLDQPNGTLVSSIIIPAAKNTDAKSKWQEVITPFNQKTKGIHDLYFVFTGTNPNQQNLFNLDWIYFSNK
ncbi:PQQ-dependent sugar dehydrogenase [Adhaeribacter radiodurans]|uniref:PQQ-dependent sugar dehydrogenase n=1 Tax=Adhaeribacter radiodurans TaxID=2745197 RepID=A0A7L7L7B4_9BACT|nr:PQQ-dependent sugar dehydrogenase [Adhaeribacter radiodurans]QMU28644.1 PQQ-dependent sugar dehydrogenase [Adhaeribacter radiodurans]